MRRGDAASSEESWRRSTGEVVAAVAVSKAVTAVGLKSPAAGTAVTESALKRLAHACTWHTD